MSKKVLVNLAIKPNIPTSSVITNESDINDINQYKQEMKL